MTIAESAIAEIKRRMHVSLCHIKPKIQTEYMIAEQTESEDFRRRYRETKADIDKLALIRRQTGRDL